MNFRQRVSVCVVKHFLLQYLDPQREHVYLHTQQQQQHNTQGQASLKGRAAWT
jgi:hypothetical protein